MKILIQIIKIKEEEKRINIKIEQAFLLNIYLLMKIKIHLIFILLYYKYLFNHII